jgi:hypothetical protein
MIVNRRKVRTTLGRLTVILLALLLPATAVVCSWLCRPAAELSRPATTAAALPSLPPAPSGAAVMAGHLRALVGASFAAAGSGPLALLLVILARRWPWGM